MVNQKLAPNCFNQAHSCQKRMNHALKPNRRKAQSEELYFHKTHASAVHSVALKRILKMENQFFI